MKKIIALGLAAAGVFWALGKRKNKDQPVDYLTHLEVVE